MATPAQDTPPPEPASKTEDEEVEAVEEEGMTVGDDEAQLMTADGEIVEMVPCALLEDGELVELKGGPGETAYIALDGAVTDDGTGTGQGLIYYATPFATDIEGLEAYATAGPGNGTRGKGYLDGQYSPAMPGNSSVLPGDRLDAAGDSRPETPEMKYSRFRRNVKTRKEKTIARVVMAVACTLLTLCVVLVGVTLSMSEHINDMVRQIHLGSKPDPKNEPKTAAGNGTANFSPQDGSRL